MLKSFKLTVAIRKFSWNSTISAAHPDQNLSQLTRKDSICKYLEMQTTSDIIFQKTFYSLVHTNLFRLFGQNKKSYQVYGV